MSDETPDRHLVETRLDSKDVFSGNLLHVRRDSVLLPDGARATREYIVHPGAVMIIPRLADGRLLMERQYRYPLERVFIEFPAGKIDPDEDPLVAAPVLRKSSCLSDKDLLEIAKSRGQQHLLAISDRKALSEALTDALMRFGDVNVSNALARNA